ncbi:hypothetical protein TREES_T100014623 [Tupaia chinensis]|uniref:Uncharacterized protein n=1 Tax=Tupaia chinensis TaxID=246437 RepID=L9KXG2_TUPCH|nr:hypothetical protein TREES_T100014623 [Tupaia chinensis]
MLAGLLSAQKEVKVASDCPTPRLVETPVAAVLPLPVDGGSLGIAICDDREWGAPADFTAELNKTSQMPSRGVPARVWLSAQVATWEEQSQGDE